MCDSTRKWLDNSCSEFKKFSSCVFFIQIIDFFKRIYDFGVKEPEADIDESTSTSSNE